MGGRSPSATRIRYCTRFPFLRRSSGHRVHKTKELNGPHGMVPKPTDRNLKSLRRHALLGVSVMAALIVGLGGWSMTTSVEGAVIANGVVVAEGGSRRVQHSEGGIVKQIMVKNNQPVEAGDVLVTLDDVSVRAELEVVMTQLREGLGTQARLAAESSGARELQIPAVASGWPLDPAFTVVMADQERLRHSRQVSMESEVSRLKQLVEEKQALIDGYNAQLEALDSQVVVVREEVGQLTTLRGKELVSNQRLNEMKRNEAELVGQIASVKASISATQSSILELKMQADQVVSDFRSEALTQLQTVSQTVSELMQRKIEAEARLKRLEIRAPISGAVHESTVRTVGGVIAPGETLMLVVPQQEDLQLDMRVSPMEINKLHVGQPAEVKLLSYDARTTPDLVGNVRTISPDMVQDAATGVQYFSVRVDIADGELEKLPQGAALVPGMPAESFFRTGERTVWSYITGPIEQRLSHTFRDN
ncbi:MAG: HlyD family type I secretion periplasmic adaptor subunit [Hyphomicrobiales bacterium]|nr:MAG: HlyD family type I secretion periplasmic adaptor subunit [Hyphomicrobiales bacterium]